MLKRLFTIAAILLFSFGLGWAIKNDPGYILISYRNWSVETSLWFGLGALLVVAFLINLLIKLIRHSLGIPQRLANWSRYKRLQAAIALLDQGVCKLLETDWVQAEKNLTRSAQALTNPLISYLGSAWAAQQQNAALRRDEYLQKAQAALQFTTPAVELYKAQLLINAQQFIQALSILQNLQNSYPKHPLLLNLLQQVYFNLQEWPSLVNLLPALAKSQALPTDEFFALSLTAYENLLLQAAQQHDEEIFNHAWLALPNNFKAQPELLLLYCRYYSQLNQAERCVPLIEAALKKQWNDELVEAYSAVISNGSKQLKTAEQWLKEYSRNASLLLTLGRLSCHEKLWGKAQQYLSASLGIKPMAKTYAALAVVQTALNQPEAAFQSYKAGLDQALTSYDH